MCFSGIECAGGIEENQPEKMADCLPQSRRDKAGQVGKGLVIEGQSQQEASRLNQEGNWLLSNNLI